MSKTESPAGQQFRRWLKRIPSILFLAAASYLFLKSHVYRGPDHVDLAALGLQFLDGKPVPPTALAGKPIVLNFWAPWCPPCRLEIPWLENLQKQYPDVAIVGVEDDSSAIQQAQEMVRQARISYAVVMPNDAVRQKFGAVAGLPTTLYISASGKVIHTVTGVVPEPVMKHYLRDTIAAH